MIQCRPACLSCRAHTRHRTKPIRRNLSCHCPPPFLLIAALLALILSLSWNRPRGSPVHKLAQGSRPLGMRGFSKRIATYWVGPGLGGRHLPQQMAPQSTSLEDAGPSGSRAGGLTAQSKFNPVLGKQAPVSSPGHSTCSTGQSRQESSPAVVHTCLPWGTCQLWAPLASLILGVMQMIKGMSRLLAQDSAVDRHHTCSALQQACRRMGRLTSGWVSSFVQTISTALQLV